MRLLALRAETMQAMRRLKLPCDDITPIGLWGSDMHLIGVNNEQFEVLRLWNVQTEDVTPATLRDLHTETVAIPTTPSAGNAASDARPMATETRTSAAPTAAPKGSPSTARPAPSARAVEVTERASTNARSAQPASSSKSSASSAAAASSTPGLDIEPPIAAVAQSPAPEAPSAVRIDPVLDLGPSQPTSTSRRDASGLTLESGTSTTSRGTRSDEPKSGKGNRAGATNGSADTEVKHAVTKDKQESSAGKLRMTVDGEHLYAEIKGGKIVLKDRTYDSLAHARDSIRRERNKVAVWEYFDEGVKAWRVLNRD